MREPDDAPDSFEEMMRSIAQEFAQSVERAVGQVDLDEIAGAVGVDPERAREWVETAGSWLRGRVERLGDEFSFPAGETGPADEAGPAAYAGGAAAGEDPLRGAGP